jgi:queuine tRNA-ribosyltransferase
MSPFSFEVVSRLRGRSGEAAAGRAGVITTPHGPIRTPAFTPVGTKATVKAVLPDTVRAIGGQVILANAYHLYLQPGADVVAAGGGLAAFMGWHGPTITDSGGFQVLSLGAGFKKVLAMDTSTVSADDVIAQGKDRLARVDDDGVTFRSHLDGSTHRFTPEVSIGVQRAIGADIIFAFDECTTLLNTRPYQERSVARTQAWAERCVAEHRRLSADGGPPQALFGVVQGAQYEDLRRLSASGLVGLGLDGFGIGGALEKGRLAEIVGWVVSELPEDKPRHLLGIGDPLDLVEAIAAGADTFDCVAPSRNARNGTVFHRQGRFHLTNGQYRRDFTPIDDSCDCPTCTSFTRAYIHHLFRAKEMLASTLATIHNERFIIRLVDQAREAIIDGTFWDWRDDVVSRLRRP